MAAVFVISPSLWCWSASKPWSYWLGTQFAGSIVSCSTWAPEKAVAVEDVRWSPAVTAWTALAERQQAPLTEQVRHLRQERDEAKSRFLPDVKRPASPCDLRPATSRNAPASRLKPLSGVKGQAQVP